MMTDSSLGMIQDLTRKVDSVKIDFESINTYINKSRSQIEDLFKKPDLSEEFSGIKGSFENLIRLFNETKSTIQSSYAEIRTLVLTLEKDMEALYEHHEVTKTHVATMEKVFALLREVLTKKHDKFADDIHAVLGSISEKQEKSLNDLRNEFITSPKAIVDSNQALLNKVESASLDGSNAMLKVNNVDLSMRMLERKVENLSLQVKKFELSSQSGS